MSKIIVFAVLGLLIGVTLGKEVILSVDLKDVLAAPVHEGKEEEPIIRNRQSCSGSSGSLVGINTVKHVLIDKTRSGNLTGSHLALIQKVETVIVKNTQYSMINSDMFHNKELRIVRMEQVYLPGLESIFLEDCKKLEEFYLIDVSSYYNFAPDVFSNVPVLKKLYIKRTKINSITDNLLKGTKTLEHLLINSANVDSVSPNAFKDTSKLKTINLENNKISIIKEGTFNNLNNLRILDLSHNQISTMTSVELPKLTALEILDLSVNTINDFVFTDLIQRFPRLKYLNITNTRIPQKSVENLLQAAATNHFSVLTGGDMTLMRHDMVLD